MHALAGRYYHADSVIHRSDPRCKLLVTAMFLPAPFLVSGWGLFALLALICALVILARVNFSFFVSGLRPLIYIFLFTMVAHGFSLGGEGLSSQVQLGTVGVSLDGFEEGVYFSLRLAILVLGASLLTMTTNTFELTAAIEFIIRPLAKLRLPVAEIALLLGLSFRFVPVLVSEADRLIKAQKARGIDFSSGGLVRRGQLMVAVLIPLFVGTIRKAKETAMAMESRGYSGSSPRSRLQSLSWSASDSLKLIGSLAVIVTIMALCN